MTLASFRALGERNGLVTLNILFIPFEVPIRWPSASGDKNISKTQGMTVGFFFEDKGTVKFQL